MAETIAAAAPAPSRVRRILALAAPTTLLSATQVAALLIEPWLAARQGTLALAGWVMHSALRLRRACRAALRARQRDWALVQAQAASAPCLQPSTQPG